MGNQSYLAKGLRDGAAIGFGYFAVSFAFGAIALQAHLSVLQSVVLSASNLTSAGQFAGVQLMRIAAPLAEIVLTVFIINIRYLLMSLSLAQRLDPSVTFAQRFVIAFGVTDEIFMVSSLSPEPVKTPYFVGLMTLPIIGWTSGTFLGATATELLPPSVAAALGIALYGMFIALLVPALRYEKAPRVVVPAAVAISVLMQVVPQFNTFSTGLQITLCTVIGAALGAAVYPLKETRA